MWKEVLRCFVLGGWGAAAVHAAEQFRLFTRPLAIPERGTVTSYALQTSSNQFCFLPPPDWVVKESPTTREVIMMAPNLVTSIRFKPPETIPDPTVRADPGHWRKEILAKHPGAKITAEFPCYTGSGSGTAFDFERVSTNKSKVSMRMAFVPMPVGTVEFSLTTPAGKLDDYHLAFGNLLTSFRVESVRAQ